MAISQPFSGKLCWMADINYPQKKKFYVEVRWLPQRVTFGWSYQQMGDWWTIRMVIFFCFFTFIQMEFLCMVELWKRTDNISGSWGFKWNWYLCYSNSKTHRSKGICYSRFAITNLPHLMAPIPCLHMFRPFFTTENEEKLAVCKDLWADVCINYKTEDFVARVKEETGGKGMFYGILTIISIEDGIAFFAPNPLLWNVWKDK